MNEGKKPGYFHSQEEMSAACSHPLACPLTPAPQPLAKARKASPRTSHLLTSAPPTPRAFPLTSQTAPKPPCHPPLRYSCCPRIRLGPFAGRSCPQGPPESPLHRYVGPALRRGRRRLLIAGFAWPWRQRGSRFSKRRPLCGLFGRDEVGRKKRWASIHGDR